MLKFVLVLFLLLCGCTSSEYQSPIMETSETCTINIVEAFSNKGYLEVVNALWGYFSANFSVSTQDDVLLLTSESGLETITFPLHGEILYTSKNDNIEYVKNDKRKVASLDITISVNDDMVVAGIVNTISDDGSHVVYPIKFDYHNQILLDNEYQDETFGKPMNFVDTLNLQIINKCLDKVNSIENIIPLLRDFEKRYGAALANNHEICEANIYDYSFEQAHINTVNIPFSSSYTRYTKININDNSYGSFDDLSRLYKSLYVVPHIEDEFSNPSEIAWDKLLTQVIEITPYDYTCEVRTCHNSDNEEYILEYRNIAGYTGINHLESINNTIKQLTLIDDVYQITDTKTLDSGVFQDKRSQDFLYLTPDGDYLQANAGIVILD